MYMVHRTNTVHRLNRSHNEIGYSNSAANNSGIAYSKSRRKLAVISPTVVTGSRGAGFLYDDAIKARQSRPQAVPDPLRQHLTGRIFQAGNIIEIVVVKLLIQGLKSTLDLSEVAYPALYGIRLTTHMHLNLYRMAMEAGTLVARPYVGQAVGAFNREYFEDFHKLQCNGTRCHRDAQSATVWDNRPLPFI